MIEITAIRLDGGEGHEHITDVMWRREATSVGQTTRQAIVAWLDESNDNEAVVAGDSSCVRLAVVRRPNQPPYLRARADGSWTDHLLSLPNF